jgi:hypothetical protein
MHWPLVFVDSQLSVSRKRFIGWLEERQSFWMISLHMHCTGMDITLVPQLKAELVCLFTI